MNVCGIFHTHCSQYRMPSGHADHTGKQGRIKHLVGLTHFTMPGPQRLLVDGFLVT